MVKWETQEKRKSNWTETHTNILFKKRPLVKEIQGQRKKNERKDMQQLGENMETQV